MKDNINLIEFIEKNKNKNIILNLAKNINGNIEKKIDKKTFENILYKINNFSKYNNITYRNYNKYFDSNKIYIIDNKGNDEYFMVYNKKCNDISLNKENFCLRIESLNKKILNKLNFQVKYKYDKEIKCNSMIFHYDDFSICFIIKKYYDFITYEIQFNIDKKYNEIFSITNFL
jgi:hypothetical protein